MRALIVVDVQNDFSSTGRLPVKGGEEVVSVINKLMPRFDKVVLTQDWHPEGHCSFLKWPKHCVQGSNGAEFIRGLDTRPANLILRKGMSVDIDSYSAFVENDRRTVTGLAGWLNMTGANEVFVCGLATDYCVSWTAIDSARSGRKTSVILDACRGILPDTIKDAMTAMAAAGVAFSYSSEAA